MINFDDIIKEEIEITYSKLAKSSESSMHNINSWRF